MWKLGFLLDTTFHQWSFGIGASDMAFWVVFTPLDLGWIEDRKGRVRLNESPWYDMGLGLAQHRRLGVRHYLMQHLYFW